MPDYPSLDLDIPWRNATLYSICGWFTSACFDHAATAFGGFFRLDEEDRTLTGCVVDPFGAAIIEGRWEVRDLTLTFTKRYVHVTDADTARANIYYTFLLDGDTWKGLYRFIEEGKTISGKTACKIAPAIFDAFGIVSGLPHH